jgi:hypothetical protein
LLKLSFCGLSLLFQLTRAEARPDEEIRRRLEALEAQQKILNTQIAELRALIGPAPDAPGPAGAGLAENPVMTAEQLQIHENRIAEQAQVKVESAQRRPVTLRGMIVFNSFWANPNSAGRQLSTFAVPERRTFAGASAQQSIIGLSMHGPVALGARWSAEVEGDFFSGGTASTALSPRLRTAFVRGEWGRGYLKAGQDRPLISPNAPNSIAHIGVPWLADSGNLWTWQPQLRAGYRIPLRENLGFRIEGALVQTNEEALALPAALMAVLANKRPGLQSRVSIFAGSASDPWIEVGSGAHGSRTIVGNVSLPSAVWTIDWRARLGGAWEFTGLAFRGQNAAHMGALRQGISFRGSTLATIRGHGGWAQLRWAPSSRLSLHAVGGQHDDRNADLRGSGIGKNQTYGANLHYLLDSNILAGFEVTETRSSYLNLGLRRIRRYDLSVAYAF